LILKHKEYANAIENKMEKNNKNEVVYRENVDESYCLAFQNMYAQFINC
jgi:hypothetical protein